MIYNIGLLNYYSLEPTGKSKIVLICFSAGASTRALNCGDD